MNYRPFFNPHKCIKAALKNRNKKIELKTDTEYMKVN